MAEDVFGRTYELVIDGGRRLTTINGHPVGSPESWVELAIWNGALAAGSIKAGRDDEAYALACAAAHCAAESLRRRADGRDEVFIAIAPHRRTGTATEPPSR